MILNCVCLVDQESAQKIDQISRELSQLTGSVKALQFVPHFTLRNDFEINPDALPQLKHDLQGVLTSFKPLTLQIKNYGFYSWKVIYLEIPPNNELNNLHKNIMNVIQKYRTSWVDRAVLDNTHFEGKQKEYVNTYGYHLAFEYFSPHITVAGNDMSQEIFEKAKSLLQSKIEDIAATVKSVTLMDRQKNNAVVLELPVTYN